MAERDTLSVDDDDAQSSDEITKDEAPKTRKLKKGWKDPNDPLAKGKFKMASGNICEHM